MKKMWLWVGLFGLLTACQSEEGNPLEPKERKDIVMSRSEEQMTEESTEFAFRFFNQINQSEKKEPNWMVSPLSASFALGMIANGAAGNTLAEIQQTLGFGQASLDEMNAYYRRMTNELLGLDNTTTMGIANSIWIRKGFKVYDSFVDINKKMYQAKVSSLDFSSPDAPAIINRWCSEQTNGCIEEVIKETQASLMYLLNALYFKGVWVEKFQESATRLEDFCGENGTKSKVQMMNQTEHFRYAYEETFCMAEFPYGNEAFSMVVVLPDEGQELDGVLEQLTFENWKKLNAQMRGQALSVKFPKFELHYKKDLIDDMKTLGVKDAFDEKADFSALSPAKLFLTLLEQYTYIKVDEKGTEAAAITVGGFEMMAPGPLSPSEVVPFHMNRPFAFFIKEKSTGTILFMGKITKL